MLTVHSYGGRVDAEMLSVLPRKVPGGDGGGGAGGGGGVYVCVCTGWI